MKKNKLHKRVEGFTLIELLVSMALTSLVITFSYTGLTYAQRTYFSYREQNNFITQFTGLKSRLELLMNQCDFVTGNGSIVNFVSEGMQASLHVEDNCFVLQKNEVTDTVRLKPLKTKVTYLDDPGRKIIRDICIETEFKDNVFRFMLEKEHDSFTKLKLKAEELGDGRN